MKIPRWVFGIIIASLCAGSMTACIFVTDTWTLSDLRFQAIHVVNPSKSHDMSDPVSDHGPDMDVLQVDFISPTIELYGFAKKADYNAGGHVSTCSHGSYDASRALDGFGYVYGDEGAIGVNRSGALPSSKSRVYRIYLLIAGKQECEGSKCPPAYDLVTSPTPICFFVGGGAFAGLSFRSNVVTVPLDAVRNALQLNRNEHAKIARP